MSIYAKDGVWWSRGLHASLPSKIARPSVWNVFIVVLYIQNYHKPIPGSTENQHKNAPSMRHFNKMKYFVHTFNVYLQLYMVSWTYID